MPTVVPRVPTYSSSGGRNRQSCWVILERFSATVTLSSRVKKQIARIWAASNFRSISLSCNLAIKCRLKTDIQVDSNQPPAVVVCRLSPPPALPPLCHEGGLRLRDRLTRVDSCCATWVDSGCASVHRRGRPPSAPAVVARCPSPVVVPAVHQRTLAVRCGTPAAPLGGFWQWMVIESTVPWVSGCALWDSGCALVETLECHEFLVVNLQ
jgi:hypothetical protein